MAEDTNNNQMESFNGNTARHRENVVRGLKREDSAILTGLRLYHNFMRQHLGLPNNMNPGKAAGIHIGGDNKWKTLMQAPTKQKSTDRITSSLIFCRRSPLSHPIVGHQNDPIFADFAGYSASFGQSSTMCNG